MGETLSALLVLVAALFAMGFALGWRREKNWADLGRAGRYGVDIAKEIAKKAEAQTRTKLIEWGVAGAVVCTGLLTGGFVAVEYAPIIAQMAPTIFEIDVGPDGVAVDPDQEIEWGDFTDWTDAQTDPNISAAGGGGSSVLEVYPDSTPSGGNVDYYGTPTGMYKTRLWSQMGTAGIQGVIIAIPDAATVDTRESWTQYAARFTREGNGPADFSMTQTGCGSAGLKFDLVDWSGVASERSDFIITAVQFKIALWSAQVGYEEESFVTPVSPQNDIDLYDGAWHMIQEHKLARGFGDNDSVYEMWVDGVQIHSLDPDNAREGILPDGQYMTASDFTDTYNCEEELKALPAGDTLSVAVGSIQKWWTTEPAWYTAYPSGQKYDG